MLDNVSEVHRAQLTYYASNRPEWLRTMMTVCISPMVDTLGVHRLRVINSELCSIYVSSEHDLSSILFADTLDATTFNVDAATALKGIVDSARNWGWDLVYFMLTSFSDVLDCAINKSATWETVYTPTKSVLAAYSAFCKLAVEHLVGHEVAQTFANRATNVAAANLCLDSLS